MTNILMTEDQYQYTLNLLNGTLQIPKSSGARCIATGCGSGKTTIIKQIIKDYWYTGVVVFCKTIDECNELYDYTMNNVVYHNDPGHSDPGKLHPDQVINLCSKPRLEPCVGKDGRTYHRCTNGVNLNWKDDLEMITKKWVVIATHSVLVNTPINALTRLSLYVLSNSPQGIIMNSMINPGDVRSFYERDEEVPDIIDQGLTGAKLRIPIRQWVLVDELPLTDPLNISIPVAGLLGFLKPTVKLTPNFDVPGELIKSKVYRKEANSTYSEFKDLYVGLESVDSKYQIPEGTELRNTRRDMLLAAIYTSMDYLISDAVEKKKSDIKVRYNLPTMIMKKGIATNVWLFEGTGDITMKNSMYSVHTFNGKYMGENVDIFKIPTNITSRSVDMDKMFSKKDDVLREIDKNIEILKNIIKANNETLIIVWKYLKSKFIDKKVDEKFNMELGRFILNDEFNLPKYIESKLIEINDRTGELIGHKFHIIHYGSGKDLATNEFRNCDSIVRMGSYMIPSYALDEINDDIGAKMSMSELILYQNIQALSRTHIRYHNGNKVRMYLSEDYNNSHFNNLSNYLTNEGCNVRMFDSSLSSCKIKSKIQLLSQYLPQVNYCLYTHQDIYLELSLDWMYNVIPMSKKEVERYSSLLLELDKIGLHIKLTTNSNNKGGSNQN